MYDLCCAWYGKIEMLECLYVVAENSWVWCVDVFDLKIHGNESRNMKMLISNKLWKEKCEMCVYNALAENAICIYVDVFLCKNVRKLI